MKLNSFNNNHHVFIHGTTEILFSYGIPVAAIMFKGKSTETGYKLDKISITTSKAINGFLENVAHVATVTEESFDHIL